MAAAMAHEASASEAASAAVAARLSSSAAPSSRIHVLGRWQGSSSHEVGGRLLKEGQLCLPALCGCHMEREWAGGTALSVRLWHVHVSLWTIGLWRGSVPVLTAESRASSNGRVCVFWLCVCVQVRVSDSVTR